MSHFHRPRRARARREEAAARPVAGAPTRPYGGGATCEGTAGSEADDSMRGGRAGSIDYRSLFAGTSPRVASGDARVAVWDGRIMGIIATTGYLRMSNQVESRRAELYTLLGDLPDRHRPIGATLRSTEDRGDYTLERWEVDLNGLEPVPGYFAKPRGATGKLPAVLYNHAHGGEYHIGKEEFIAPRRAIQQPPYALALAREGYASLCIDAWAFGSRATRSESAIFKRMLWEGRVMWGMMVYDSLRAVDYLVSRDDVDPTRLATMGLSMGSTMAWWLAALDERIKVCVDLLCLTDFQALIETGHLDGHGIYYYVPRLLKHFTSAQINALIAPRPHLSLAGEYDKLTPPLGLDRIDRELREVYAAAGAPEAWQLRRYPVGHEETPEMRAEVLAFLRRWL
jgi:dienelactone hydrolase